MEGQTNVVILTDAFWRQRFGSDPNVLDRETRIMVSQERRWRPAWRFSLSLVRSARFSPDKISGEQRGPKARHSGGGGTHMIARLKPGATIAEAQAQIDAHNAEMEKDDPEAKMMAEAGFRSPVFSLHADHVHSIRPTLCCSRPAYFFSCSLARSIW